MGSIVFISFIKVHLIFILKLYNEDNPSPLYWFFKRQFR
jgi:hypothetical protein